MTDYSGERQHVKLYFQQPLKPIELPFAATLKQDQVDAHLTRNETEELIRFLQKQHITPFKIERSSILYDKYMEIAS